MAIMMAHQDYSTLNYRQLGPFCINGKINDVTFRLDVPAQLRIHLVFHSFLLNPIRTSLSQIVLHHRHP